MSLTPTAARVLAAQIAAELERIHMEATEIQRVGTALAAGSTTEKDLLWSLAGHLQAFYSGIEAVLSRILKEVDGFVPGGSDSHQEMLRQASIEVAGVRPAVLDSPTAEALAPYRAFRHFFRHAYGVTLRWEKLEHKVQRAEETSLRFSRRIAEFQQFLQSI